MTNESMTTIRFVCANCQSRLSAKEKLLGQTRNCPKCGKPVLITQSDAAAGPPHDDAPAEPIEPITGPPIRLPREINRQSHYVICDRARLVATWKNDGQGWMLKTNAGLVPAVRNSDQLPNQGDFQLVELCLDKTDDGLRLRGLRVYQLALRWALICLDRSDEAIVSKITGPGCLNREQKNVVRQVLKDHFMREVWTGAENVLEYLADSDFHSPGTG
jgi:hypothetical protein